MENVTMNTDQRIYLVKFNHILTGGKFIISSAEELVKLLKQEGKASKGIESLKTFDPVKDKFVRISKEDFLRFNSWQTGALEYLKNYYFFKK